MFHTCGSCCSQSRCLLVHPQCVIYPEVSLCIWWNIKMWELASLLGPLLYIFSQGSSYRTKTPQGRDRLLVLILLQVQFCVNYPCLHHFQDHFSCLFSSVRVGHPFGALLLCLTTTTPHAPPPPPPQQHSAKTQHGTLCPDFFWTVLAHEICTVWILSLLVRVIGIASQQ